MNHAPGKPPCFFVLALPFILRCRRAHAGLRAERWTDDGLFEGYLLCTLALLIYVKIVCVLPNQYHFAYIYLFNPVLAGISFAAPACPLSDTGVARRRADRRSAARRGVRPRSLRSRQKKTGRMVAPGSVL